MLLVGSPFLSKTVMLVYSEYRKLYNNKRYTYKHVIKLTDLGKFRKCNLYFESTKMQILEIPTKEKSTSTTFSINDPILMCFKYQIALLLFWVVNQTKTTTEFKKVGNEQNTKCKFKDTSWN